MVVSEIGTHTIKSIQSHLDKHIIHVTLCEVYVIFEDCRTEGFEVVRDRLPPRDQPCSRSAFAGAVKSMIEVAELPKPTPLLHVDILKPAEDFQSLQISKRLATTKLK